VHGLDYGCFVVGSIDCVDRFRKAELCDHVNGETAESEEHVDGRVLLGSHGGHQLINLGDTVSGLRLILRCTHLLPTHRLQTHDGPGRKQRLHNILPSLRLLVGSKAEGRVVFAKAGVKLVFLVPFGSSIVDVMESGRVTEMKLFRISLTGIRHTLFGRLTSFGETRTTLPSSMSGCGEAKLVGSIYHIVRAV
jgi:hypothetical protein